MRNGALFYIELICSLSIILFMVFRIDLRWYFVPILIMGVLRFGITIIVCLMTLFVRLENVLNKIFDDVEKDKRLN